MHRPTRKTLAAIAPFLLLTACAGSTPTTEVAAHLITGTWTGPHDEKITFAGDHSFNASGLGSANLAPQKCADKPSNGGWAFYAPGKSQGSEFSDKSATSGSWIAVIFHGAATDCRFDLAVVDKGKALCATDDRDFPCGLDVKFTRSG